MISPEQRARLAQRLVPRTDAADRGETLPATAAALNLEDPAQRLEALVAALVTERVILPVHVEGREQFEGDHHPGGGAHAALATVPTSEGPAVAVYSSAARLAADRPGARPMASPAQQPALAALVDTGGHLVVDHGFADVVVPRPATAALAQGDRWLPAWRDHELREELRRRAATSGAASVVDVRVRFGGGVLTRVEVVVAEDTRHGNIRGRLAAALEVIGASQRLRAACDRVELVPIPVAVA